MDIINQQEFRFDQIMSFIEKSLNDFRNHRFNRDNIIILLPPHFSIIYEIYMRERYFKSHVIFSENTKDKIKYEGVEILFLSPENKCYVMTKDYSYNIDNELRHSLCLEKFTTK